MVLDIVMNESQKTVPITLETRTVNQATTKNTAASTVLEIALDEQERHLFRSLSLTAEALSKGQLKGFDGSKAVEIRYGSSYTRVSIPR